MSRATDCPKCPKCGAGVAVPLAGDDRTAGAAKLRCPACGAVWVEANVGAIARAWYAQGAYDQHCDHEEGNGPKWDDYGIKTP